MGDSGRSMWPEGAEVVSDAYLERRFLNGALRSGKCGNDTGELNKKTGEYTWNIQGGAETRREARVCSLQNRYHPAASS